MKPLAIAGIGACGAGAQAFPALIREIDPASRMAFVLVTCCGDRLDDALYDPIARNTSIPIVPLRLATPVEPGHLYLVPPGVPAEISKGTLRFAPDGGSNGARFPIDYFLRSLAHDQEHQAIGVVLSDKQSDGALGLTAVHSAGGVTLGSGIILPHTRAELAQPPEEIASTLRRIEARRSSGLTADRVTPQEVNDVYNLLRKANLGLDFGCFGATRVARRIERRMLVAGIEDVAEYIHCLTLDATELTALARDILARDTRFGEDPDLLEFLRTSFVPSIARNRSPDSPIRVWLPDCGTAQGAYSVAICILEALEAAGQDIPVKILATDADESAVRIAAKSTYSEASALDLAPQQLQRFFVKTEQGYHVSRRLRGVCFIARHNLFADTPYSKVDLVCHRVPLDWFGSRYQEQLAAIFHYALNPGGYVVARVGKSGQQRLWSELFTSEEEKPGVYRRQPVPARLDSAWFAAGVRSSAGASRPAGVPLGGGEITHLRRQATRAINARYRPTGVVVDKDLHIVEFRGHTSPYLEPAPGAARYDVLSMARNGLGSALRRALDQARETNDAAFSRGVVIEEGKESRDVHIEVIPLGDRAASECGYLILFDGAAARAARNATSVENSLEALWSEQRFANEELEATNEKLRHTYTDLEAAREDLLSAHEEMLAVNEELRKRTSELALASNDLTNVLACVDLAIVILDSDLRIRLHTPGAEGLLNLSSADLGRSLAEVSPNINVQGLAGSVNSVVSTGSTWQQEVQDRDGRWHLLSIRPYRTDEREIAGAVLTLVDVDALKKSREALEASERRYRVVSQVTSDYAYALRVGRDGHPSLEWITEAFTRITGYRPEELGGDGFEELVHPEDRAAWRARFDAAMSGAFMASDYRILTKTGEVRWVHDRARAEHGDPDGGVRVYGAVQDVTRRKDAEEALRLSEEQLRQSQKMEAVGRLAGGVAHDFNNLLTAIQGYSELLLISLRGREPLRRHVDEIRKAAERAAALTRQLLAFSRRQILQPRIVDPNMLVADLSLMLRRLIGEDIELVTILGDDLGQVKADPSQIEQVIVNLAVNARDAGATRLTVTTTNVDVEEGHNSPASELAPGRYVMLAFIDNGSGMDAETRSHLFEPFFTTKDQGKGTGLGLSMVYGIVKQSGGSISVESHPGRGSTFHVYLPRAGGPFEPLESKVSFGELPHGSETVLLVEDDEAVRSLASLVLARSGYTVLEAPHAAAALQLADGPREIHLLLTDIVMPGLSGRELADRLAARRPDMKTMLMSGYTDEATGRSLAPGIVFLQKPFTPDILARRVRELLDAPSLHARSNH